MLARDGFRARGLFDSAPSVRGFLSDHKRSNQLANLGLQPPRSSDRTLLILPRVVQVAFQFGEVAKPLPHTISLKLN